MFALIKIDSHFRRILQLLFRLFNDPLCAIDDIFLAEQDQRISLIQRKNIEAILLRFSKGEGVLFPSPR